MSYRIQFLKDTSKAIIPDQICNEKTLLLYREGFNIPNIPGAVIMDFEKYRNVYSEIHPEVIVLVGLNRIITPSNRCDFVFEYLQTTTPQIKKYSIDTHPFIGEPWRLWYHFSFTNTGSFAINYSYVIETEWQHWFYRDAETCRLHGKEVRKYISDVYSDIDKLTTQFNLFEIESNIIDWYNKAKMHVFDKYETPKLIISNLLKLSNEKFGKKITFDSYLENDLNELPDIGIYRFMKEENERRMNTYNALIWQQD